MADPRIRQLDIKTGVVRRLTKEKTCYEKEVHTEEARLDKFKANGEDEHKLKKQEEVIQECLMMLPDVRRRLQKEYELLAQYLESEKDLRETEAFTKATQVLEEAKQELETKSE